MERDQDKPNMPATTPPIAPIEPSPIPIPPKDEELNMDDNMNTNNTKNEIETPRYVTPQYYCPMHCEGDKTYDQPGNCPVCGMHLVELKTSE